MAAKTTAEKIAAAKKAAKYAQAAVTDNNTNRKGNLSSPNRFTYKVTSPATRLKDLNALNDKSKTAGRAKNVASKLAKASANKPVKITGSATGTKTPKPTKLKDYQKISKTAKKTK